MNHADHVALIRAGVSSGGVASGGAPAGRAPIWADVGAGTGAFTLALAELLGPGARIVAIDRDAGALRENARSMRERFPAVGHETVVADLTRPPAIGPLDGLVAANSLLDNAELSLAKADMGVARLYARLARNDGDDRRWAAIETEHERAVALLLRVTGRDRLLDDAPVLQRSIALRNPYVDSLSELQVRLLARLRALDPDDPERPTVLRLVQLTVNGVAAGLQNTG